MSARRFAPLAFLQTLISLALVAALVAGGLAFTRSRAAATIYRDRLAELSEAHASLIDRYNDAVRRTAVTELLVRDAAPGGDPPALAVRVRTPAGVLREIATPFDPRREVFVDFVVVDGRLWIRRVYDDATPPSRGLVIDADVDGVDWDAPGAIEGKVVYRALAPGRWIVTTTGTGALGLARVGAIDDPPAELAGPVEMMDLDEIEAEVREAREAIGLGDLWRWARGSRADREAAPDRGNEAASTEGDDVRDADRE